MNHVAKKIELVMAVCLIIAAFFLARQSAAYVSSEKATTDNTQQDNASQDKNQKNGICIVIDPGHGGFDPGKVGVNKALEKDINLAIALQLKEALSSEESISVVMTRDSDSSLSDENVKNMKVSDMQNRCERITEANPLFTVSIHQNSYTTSDIKGAQVFYYGQSTEGKKLADTMQNSLIANLDPSNKRMAKANESYYLLKKTPTPTIIVECGFLSNPTEADLLLDADYQSKIVNAIYLGILDYLKAEQLLPVT